MISSGLRSVFPRNPLAVLMSIFYDSPILRSLNLLEVPTGGQILFEGTDITDPKVEINRHRQKIGMVLGRILQQK